MGTSAYSMFGTNTDLETNGIRLNYGSFYFDVARAGGANKKFSRLMEAKTRPYRRAIQTETLDEAISTRLLREVVAEAVVLGWGSDTHGPGVFEGRDGGPLPFSHENVMAVFNDLPELFKDVYEQAMKTSLFRQDDIDADAKNS